jgi:ABC-2 type transport system ATP-binding protein
MAGAGRRLGDRWVLRNLDLDVAPGTIVGLIGPSGCGKTTAARLATGVYRPDEGEVSLLGRDPADLSSDERTRIGYLPQHPVLLDELSLWENLTFHAALNGVRLLRRRHLKRLLELVELSDDRRKPAREAPIGMKRRLALAAALVHEPALILLDEPTAGVDPVLHRTLWRHLGRLRDDGRALLVTTQRMGEAALCDLVVLLTDGRIAAAGSPDELRRRAVGGDLIQIETRELVESSVTARIRALPEVGDLTMTSPTRFRLVVDDGSAALVAVRHLLESSGCEVISSEQVDPEHGEVLVRLLDRSAAEGGAEERSP